MLIDKRIKYVERDVFPDTNPLSWEVLKSIGSESFFFIQKSTIFLAEFYSGIAMISSKRHYQAMVQKKKHRRLC